MLNIHGGGQYASYRSVLTNAKRGYTTISIAWAGRIAAPNYQVSPDIVKLFWEGKSEDPRYKITTDWGALDAYHAPSRFGVDAFVSVPDGSQKWTFDDIASPRNISWFPITLAARRALTFLEQQPQVDLTRLGVYGHSMGGKLTIATAGSDSRVKAAVPSCGGISDRYNENPLHREVVGDSPALRAIDCPTLFLSPANDFHGHINNLIESTAELGDNEWRVVCSPHLNHRDAPEAEVATQLWFDQHLKNQFSWPQTPRTELKVESADGVPRFTVYPDTSRPVQKVEVYYTQQGKDDGDRAHHENRINRFWHFAKATSSGGAWKAELPVFRTDLPLWVYAHVTYSLDQSIAGAGYYYGNYETNSFTLSSLLRIVKPEELKAANVKPVLTSSLSLEDFEGDWRKEWFTHNASTWEIRTHKVYHPIWAAPEAARLSLSVRSQEPNKLVVGIDEFAAEVSLQGGDTWQTVTLTQADFQDANGAELKQWDGIKELRLLPSETLRSGRGAEQIKRKLGEQWNGPDPEFRALQWQE